MRTTTSTAMPLTQSELQTLKEHHTSSIPKPRKFNPKYFQTIAVKAEKPIIVEVETDSYEDYTNDKISQPNGDYPAKSKDGELVQVVGEMHNACSSCVHVYHVFMCVFAFIYHVI